jgi:hypothetical protein
MVKGVIWMNFKQLGFGRGRSIVCELMPINDFRTFVDVAKEAGV